MLVYRTGSVTNSLRIRAWRISDGIGEWSVKSYGRRYKVMYLTNIFLHKWDSFEPSLWNKNREKKIEKEKKRKYFY